MVNESPRSLSTLLWSTLRSFMACCSSSLTFYSYSDYLIISPFNCSIFSSESLAELVSTSSICIAFRAVAPLGWGLLAAIMPLRWSWWLLRFEKLPELLVARVLTTLLEDCIIVTPWRDLLIEPNLGAVWTLFIINELSCEERDIDWDPWAPLEPIIATWAPLERNVPLLIVTDELVALN